jgi:dUTP pyrophosphatase
VEEEWFAGDTDPLPHPMMDLHRKMLGCDPPGPLVLRVKRLHPDAVLPTKPFDDDAGWDLHLAADAIAYPHEVARLRTEVAIVVPAGWMAVVRDRSGLASRGLTIFGGVMDAGYTGGWVVLLYNSGDDAVPFRAGDRIAQFTLHRLHRARLEEVAELPPSARGAGGFGSTGR